MSRHSTEDIEALKSAPERYRPDVQHRRGWLWEAGYITTHVIVPVFKRLNDYVEYDEAQQFDVPVDRPALVLGQRWARWKARRMIAAQQRRDVREGQPWVVTG